jgi:hypothetical protein
MNILKAIKHYANLPRVMLITNKTQKHKLYNI